MSPELFPLRGRRIAVLSAAVSLGVGLFAAAPAIAAAEGQGPSEIGVWYDDTGDGAVEIFACGNKLCGRIVWLKNPLNSQGKPLSDGYNPVASLRTRPICGLPILRDLQRMTDGSWDFGTVYDPKKGSQHEAAIKLLRQDKLQLTGFGLGRLLSKSFIWTRAPADLQLCTAPTNAAAPAAPKAPAQAAKPAGDVPKASATTKTDKAVPAPQPATKPAAATGTQAPDTNAKSAGTSGTQKTKTATPVAGPAPAQKPVAPKPKPKPASEVEADTGVLSRPGP